MGEVIQIYEAPVRRDEIALDEVIRRRQIRRKRVAARVFKKYPLFAEQFMAGEFPDITQEEIVELIQSRKPSKSVRSKKSGLAKYGRYPLYLKHIQNYHLYKNPDDLREAQRLRENMAKDFLFEMRCQGEKRVYRLPATASLPVVRKIASLKFSTWKELEQQWDEVTKYGH